MNMQNIFVNTKTRVICLKQDLVSYVVLIYLVLWSQDYFMYLDMSLLYHLYLTLYFIKKKQKKKHGNFDQQRNKICKKRDKSL